MSKVVQGKAVSRKRSDPPCRRNGLHCYRLCSSVLTKIPTLARRSCVRKDRNCTRRNLVAVLVMPRYAIPLGMARRKAKNWPPGAVSTGNTKYSPGAIAINGGGFNELEVAPLALITWSHTKMTSSGFGDVVRQPVQGRGRTTHPARLALPALPALPPILRQSTITSSHNHCLARKAPPERANWNTLRSNITGI